MLRKIIERINIKNYLFFYCICISVVILKENKKNVYWIYNLFFVYSILYIYINILRYVWKDRGVGKGKFIKYIFINDEKINYVVKLW